MDVVENSLEADRISCGGTAANDPLAFLEVMIPRLNSSKSLSARWSALSSARDSSVRIERGEASTARPADVILPVKERLC